MVKKEKEAQKKKRIAEIEETSLVSFAMRLRIGRHGPVWARDIDRLSIAHRLPHARNASPKADVAGLAHHRTHARLRITRQFTTNYGPCHHLLVSDAYVDTMMAVVPLVLELRVVLVVIGDGSLKVLAIWFVVSAITVLRVLWVEHNFRHVFFVFRLATVAETAAAAYRNGNYNQKQWQDHEDCKHEVPDHVDSEVITWRLRKGEEEGKKKNNELCFCADTRKAKHKRVS